MLELRPYQVDALNAVRRSYATGHRRPCLVAPCGAGKTVIVAEMARSATAKGNRVLCIVHRQELVDQMAGTFAAADVNMDLCSVGMVQTVTRRIGKIDAPTLIITDENHHAKANSYKRIYDAYPDARCVGVTATPVRLDGSGLAGVNDDLVVSVTAKWLIANGYLAPYDYYAPPIDADFSGARIARGEYDSRESEGKLLRKAIYGDVIAHYNALASGRQAICYCVTVAHSRAMAEAFNSAGIPAAHIDGDTPKEVRKEIISDFRRGDVRVLCNMDLISEGFDVPDCECAILLRPTMSLTLHIQQSMRCMRHKDGKRAIILDHVGNYTRHGMPDDDREWTLEGRKRKRGQGEGAVLTRQCPQCYCIHRLQDSQCPACGYVYPPPERTLEEIKEARLEQVRGVVINYAAPGDCRSYEELRVYAKQHGYKPGWAWYQAKQRGWLGA